jgi:hypothetical protein
MDVSFTHRGRMGPNRVGVRSRGNGLKGRIKDQLSLIRSTYDHIDLPLKVVWKQDGLRLVNKSLKRDLVITVIEALALIGAHEYNTFF